jgi:NDP-hexose 4,6-dehydratase
MNNFWKDKKVLVTGADGFIGSHLTDKLIKNGAIVSIFIRNNSLLIKKDSQNFRNIGHQIKNLKSIITGDIGSRDSVELIRKNNPNIIFHLAADAYVPNSFDHPIEVKETNLDGTLNVLHAAMNINTEQIVCTSSSEIYGTHDNAINEKTPLYPSSPYAASKVAADRYCFSYWNTYGLPISIIRPFNTYGPRHTYDVIPKFIKLALVGKALTIHGDGTQTRDFTYIDDMVNAFLLMGSDKKTIGQSVNFGSGKDVSINDIAKMIISASNSKSEIKHIEERTSEVSKLLCNYNKAKKLFGWAPTIGIEEGIKKNVEWEIKNMAIKK